LIPTSSLLFCDLVFVIVVILADAGSNPTVCLSLEIACVALARRCGCGDDGSSGSTERAWRQCMVARWRQRAREVAMKHTECHVYDLLTKKDNTLL